MAKSHNKKSRAKASPGAVRTGKALSRYDERLATLRALTSEFDSKKFNDAMRRKPRSEAGKREKEHLLRKVRETFKRARPFVHRPHKFVKPPKSKVSARNLEELRRYAGLPKFKGLRAVPLTAAKPKTIRVRWDKRGRVTMRADGATQKLFLFPHAPRSGDEAIEFVETMLAQKLLPAGAYIVASRHHFLVGGAAILADRSQLAQQFRDFVYRYQGSNPEFIKTLYGLKWLGRDAATIFRRQGEIQSERERAKIERKRLTEEKAARAIRTMHYQLTGERLPTRKPKLSKRARATGRR